MKSSEAIAVRNSLIAELDGIYSATAADEEIPAIVDYLLANDLIVVSRFEGAAA